MVTGDRTQVAPGIYKQDGVRGVRYHAFYRDEEGRKRSKTFIKLADARQFRHQVMGDKVKARSQGGVTFADLSTQYVELHPNWRESTANSVRWRLKRPLETWGSKEAASIKTSDVRKYLAGLQVEGQSTRTLEAVRALLRAVFQVGVEDGQLSLNPVAPVQPFRDDRTREEKDARLTSGQVKALREAMPSDEWRGFFDFIYATGLRASEAAGLTWDRCDFLRRRIRVDRQLVSGNYGDPVWGPPKSKASTRWVPMRPGVSEVLEAQRERHPVSLEGLVWVTEWGAPMVKSSRGDAWRHAAKGLDLPPAVKGWHSLRHTCGSILLDQGHPPTTVAAVLGHDVAELLRVYAHPDQDYSDALLDAPTGLEEAG